MVCTKLICKGLQQNLCNAVLWPCKAEGHVVKAACLGGCLLLASVIFARSKYDSFGGEAAVAAVAAVASLVAAAGGGAEEGRGGKKGTHFFLSTVTRKVTVGVSSHLLSSALLIGRWKWK